MRVVKIRNSKSKDSALVAEPLDEDEFVENA